MSTNVSNIAAAHCPWVPSSWADPRVATPRSPETGDLCLALVWIQRLHSAGSPQPGAPWAPTATRAQLPFLIGTGLPPHTSDFPHPPARLSCLPELELGPERENDLSGPHSQQEAGPGLDRESALWQAWCECRGSVVELGAPHGSPSSMSALEASSKPTEAPLHSASLSEAQGARASLADVLACKEVSREC